MIPAPHDLPHPHTEAAPLPSPGAGQVAVETSRLLAEGVAHQDGVRWNHVYGITTDAVSKSGQRP